MNLLIITQTLDSQDPLLGFFHNWVKELSGRFNKVIVICLNRGVFNLPANVEVFSLEKPPAGWPNRLAFRIFLRLRSLAIFIKIIVKKQSDYDAVLVHMNQEYVLWAGWWWKLIGKKVYMWRNHPVGGMMTRLAGWFSKSVFYTSSFSYTASFYNSVQMPVGIDTDFFTPSQTINRSKDIIFVGRIDPSKQPLLLLQALKIISSSGLGVSATMVGKSSSGNEDYYQVILDFIKSSGLQKQVNLVGPVPNSQLPEYYQNHKVFVNLAPSGCLDKTIFEAMACGCAIVVTNEFLRQELGDEIWVKDGDPRALAAAIQGALSQKQDIDLRKYVVGHHSLNFLGSRLAEEIKS